MGRNGTPGRIAMAVAAALLVGWTALRDREVRDRPGSARAGDTARAERGHRGGRGRGAESATAIPAAGWKDILWRTYGQVQKDRVMLVAAGVTFYGLLALFPALTAFVSIYGMFADPDAVVAHVERLSEFMPEGAVEIIGGQMNRIASQPAGQLQLGFVLGLGITLWSANNGMKAIFEATNVAYNEEEKRSFVGLTAITLLFTLGAMIVLFLLLGAIVVLPIAMGLVGLEGAAATALRLGRWPLLLVVLIGAISLIYRYGPSRSPAQWRWVFPGSILAALVWVAASLLFSWYVSNFDSYNETYGSLGAVIAAMVWMWLSAMIVIMGAELNAELEHQTARDSTTGPPAPSGSRGAMVADTLGDSARQ